MRKLYLSLVALILSSNASFSQTWDWATSWDTIGNISIESYHAVMLMGSDNNLYILGIFKDNNLQIGTQLLTKRGGYDIFLCSYDSDGNFRWATCIGSASNDDIAGITLDASNNIYIGGAYSNTVYFTPTDYITIPYSGYDSFIAKYSSNGSFLWARRVFSGTDVQRLQDIELDRDNNQIVVVGTFKTQMKYYNGTDTTTLTAMGPKDQFIATLNTSATSVSDISVFRTSNQSTTFKKVKNYIIGSSVNGYYISGDLVDTIYLDPSSIYPVTDKKYSASLNKNDALLIQVDENLDPQWARRGGGSANDHVNSSRPFTDGSIYITGKTESSTVTTTFDSTETSQSATLTNLGVMDYYIAKYNLEGRLMWVKRDGTAWNDDAFGLAVNDSLVQFAGNVSASSSNINTGFAVYDHDGNFIAQQMMSGTLEDRGKAVVFDNVGNNYVMGYFKSNPLTAGTLSLPNTSGTYDAFLVKYSYPLSLKVTHVQNITCNGDDDGSITVQAVYGTPPYVYSWDPNVSSSNTASNLAPGDYEIIVTDDASDKDTLNITITEPAALSISRTITDVSCNSSNYGTTDDGSINITVSGGASPYTYQWSATGSGDPDDEDQAGLIKGNYTVTVTDAHGCQLDSTFNVGEPTLLQTSIVGTDVSSSGAGDGEADLTVTGGTSPYGYAWTGPGGFTASTEDIDSLDGGVYQVGVSDTHSCSDTNEVIIDEPGMLITSISGTNITCNGDGDGTITVSTNGGGLPPYIYHWSDDPLRTDSFATGLDPGFYQVIVNDQGTAADTVSITLTQPTALTVNLTGTDATCYDKCDGKITLTRSGGTSPYTYAWTGPDGYNSSDQNLIELCDGMYNVTVTDHHGCQNMKSKNIGQPTKIQITVTDKVNATCNGDCDGTIDLTVSGGSSPYTYLWSNSRTTQDLNLLCAGSYSVTVTDHSGCTEDRAGILITEPNPITIGFTSVVYNICHENNGACIGEATADPSGGTPPYTDYLWKPTGQTSSHAIELCAGTHWVLVTDSHGCIDSNDVAITQPTEITLDTANQDISCFGLTDGIISLTPSPPDSYTWKWEDDLGETGPVRTNLSEGWYTGIATNASWCSDTASVYISEPEVLNASIGFDSITCYGESDGEIRLRLATGGYGTYQFTINGGTAWQNDSTFSGLPAAAYDIRIRDKTHTGCVIILNSSWDLPQPAVLNATVAPDSVTCNGESDGEITLSSPTGGSGEYDYTKDGGTNWQTSNIFSGLLPGTYDVRMRDKNHTACVVTLDATTDIYEPEVLSATVTPDSVTCNGDSDGTITISSATGGSGHYEYSINGGTDWQAGSIFSGLTTGTYDVRMRDMAHTLCVITIDGSLEVPEPDVMSGSVGADSVTCNGDSDGVITISSATGGSGHYEYSINGGTDWQAGSVFTGLTAGTYDVQMRDMAHTSCEVTVDGSLEVPEPDVMSGSTGADSVTCNGGSDGVITISSATGGSGHYEYSVNGGTDWQAGSIFSGLTTGTYDVRMRDMVHTLCVITIDGSLEVPEPDPMNISLNTVSVTCNGASDGTITTLVSGGTLPYSYDWTGPDSYTSTDKDISGLAAGTYHLTVTDGHGCTDTSSTIVTEPNPLTIGFATTQNTCNGGAAGEIDATINGGTFPYIYTWTGPDSYTSTDEDITGLEEGTYTLVVEDAHSCTTTDSTTLTDPGILDGDVAADSATCNGVSDGSITISNVSGGSGTYEFAINSVWQPDSSFMDIPAGTYNVRIRDAADTNCIIVLDPSLEVGEPAPLTIGCAATQNTCNGGTAGEINATVSNGTAPYTYSWTGPDDYTSTDEDITGLKEGMYHLTVEDAHNCTVTDSSELTDPDVLYADVDQSDITCNGASDGSIMIRNITGGSGVWQFSIDNVSWQYDSTFTGLVAGIYPVSMRDAVDPACVVTLGSPVINEPAVIIVTSVDSTDVTCNDASDGTITIVASGGTGTLEYSIDSSNTFVPNGGVFTGLAEGEYYLFVRDANLCMVSAGTATINEPAALIVTSVDSTDVTCNGASDGTITIVASGGTGTLEYSTDSSSTFVPNGGVFTGLAAGKYYLFVRDANVCTVNAGTATINEPAAITVTSVDSTDVSCNGLNDGSINITVSGGTPPYEYSIDSCVTFISNGGTFTGLASGTYYLCIRDANGCTFSAGTATINEPAQLTTVLAATQNTCNGGTAGAIDATASGGTSPYTYNWTGPDGYTSISEDITGLAEGVYHLVVTDAQSCSMEDSATLTDPAALYGEIDHTDVSCNGGSDGCILIRNISGGSGSWQFSKGDGLWQTDSTICGLAAGTYDAMVRDAADTNCVLTFDFVLVINEPSAIVITSVDSTDVTCNGASDGTITIVASGGTGTIEYSIDSSDTFVSNGGIFTDLTAHTYYLFVKDANMCTVSAGTATIINETDAISIGFSVTQNTCNGGSAGAIDVAVSGGSPPYAYNWTGPNGYTSTEEDITGLSEGEYILVVTDAKSCNAVKTDTLTDPEELDADVTAVEVTCNGESDGSIIFSNMTGGLGVWYEFAVSGTWRTDSVFYGLSAGTYYPVMRDVGDTTCTREFEQVTITEPDPIDIGSVTHTDITCNGDNDGSIIITASGGTPPLTYQLVPGGPDDGIFEGLGPGKYVVDVNDANSCGPVESDTIEIIEPLPITIDRLVITPSVEGESNGAIYVKVSGGTVELSVTLNNEIPPDSNNIIDGSQEFIFNGLPAGDYTINIADENGCEKDTTVTVASIPAPQMFIKAYEVITPNGDGKNEVWYIVVYRDQYALDNDLWEPVNVVFPNCVVKVFTPTGKLVFSTKKYDKQWDGIVNGKKVDPGTYYYVINPGKGKDPVTGSLTIIY